MNREDALQLVHDWTKNPNLIKHMLAVEAQMRALARHFGEDEDLWGLAGLLHDADYEMFKDDPKKHPSKIFDELEARNADPRVTQAIKAHAWGWKNDCPKPSSKMDWALYTCDDLSGFVIACALVRPEKLASLTVDNLLKKWPEKSFAAGAKREPALMTEKELGIPLKEYMSICLSALQRISNELGL